MPIPRWRCAPPHSTAQMGPRAQKGTGLGSQRPLYRRNSPHPRPDQSLSKARRAKRPNVEKPGRECSACPPKANPAGIRVPGNQSCRASGRWLRAGRLTRASGRGWKEAPGARRGRWPCREQVVRRLRSRPHGSNFPSAWRANGAEKVREAGREGAVRGSRYRVRVRRSAASRLRLCSPPGRPPRAACSAAGHRRVSPPAQKLTRGTPAAPASPWAGRPPLAACNFRRTAGSDEARPKRPEALHPRAPCPGTARPAPLGSAPGRRRTRLLAGHRAAQPAPLSHEPPLPLKSAINFPSLPPPHSAPATQTPPPDAPSRAPSSPAPARPAAPRRPPPPRRARGARWPGPGHAPTPGSRAEPGRALRA